MYSIFLIVIRAIQITYFTLNELSQIEELVYFVCIAKFMCVELFICSFIIFLIIKTTAGSIMIHFVSGTGNLCLCFLICQSCYFLSILLTFIKNQLIVLFISSISFHFFSHSQDYYFLSFACFEFIFLPFCSLREMGIQNLI